MEFNKEWDKVHRSVYLFCARQKINGVPISVDDVKDLSQEIALKAWKNFSSWRADSSFIFWIFKIAHRVVYDYFARRQKEEALLLKVKPEQEEQDKAYFEAKGISLGDKEILNGLLQAMIKTNWPGTTKPFLNEVDLAVIRTKIDYPHLSSAKLAEYLQISPTSYDTRFCRALVESRVYCFQYRPALLGGLERIRKKFEGIIAYDQFFFSQTESVMFKSMILEKNFDHRPAGWQNSLRSACDKMIFSDFNEPDRNSGD